MKKAVFIVGPTATGKTELAYKIANITPTYLISADSVQIYKGLDIISGKDLPEGAKFTNDHYIVNSTDLFLVNIVSPNTPFSVYDFVNLVKNIVSDPLRQSKIPIVVGGTRFYINALTSSIETLSIRPNHDLRKRLEDFDVSKLQKELEKRDPEKIEGMNNSDINNRRRLTRAIEVAGLKSDDNIKPVFNEKEILIIGLFSSMENLRKRISERLDRRRKQGAIEEARRIFTDYDQLSNQVKNTNGYKQLFEHFLGKLTLEEAIEKWKLSEFQLARRQLSWIRNKKGINLFDIEKKEYQGDISRLIHKELGL